MSQQRQVLLLANYKECGSPSASRARAARGRIPPALNWGRWARTLAEGGLLDGGGVCCTNHLRPLLERPVCFASKKKRDPFRKQSWASPCLPGGRTSSAVREPPTPVPLAGAVQDFTGLSQQRQVLLADYNECGSPSASRAREARGRNPPALNWGRWARTLAEGGLLDGLSLIHI